MNELKPLKFSRKLQKHPKKWRWFILAIILLVGLGIFLLSHSSTSEVLQYAKVLGKQDPLQEENGKINILLLGIAGANHDGANLTDTIMVASYDTKTHKADLISIPRDLWISQYKDKVNALYEIGIEKGNGLTFARQQIGNILGISIPYAVRIDFNGFVKAVDLVGGVDVVVPTTFDDYAYPNVGHEDDMCGYQQKEETLTPDQAQSLGVPAGPQMVLLGPTGKIATSSSNLADGIQYTDDDILQYFPCRYLHIHFDKGLTHMDGSEALEFARSRHGTNGEGSDFARSRRQQLILQAFRSKVLSLNTFTDPNKIISLVQTLNQSVDTNISQSNYLDFFKLVKNVDGVHSSVINGTDQTPILINPSSSDYGGAWVLIPPNNDFSIVHKYVNGILAGETPASASAQALPDNLR